MNVLRSGAKRELFRLTPEIKVSMLIGNGSIREDVKESIKKKKMADHQNLWRMRVLLY